MKRRFDLRTAVTVLFAIGLLAIVGFRTGGTASWLRERFAPKASAGPEDSIYAMLDAARAGDVGAYLDSFSGPMRDQLQQVIKEDSEPKFASYLRAQNTAFQSVAVSLAPRQGDSEALARVEYVYSDRNEVQSLYLRKEAARWRIVKIATADRLKTLVPFGSNVNE